MKPPSPHLARLSQEVDAAVHAHLDRLAADEILADGLPDVVTAARRFVSTGGKRMRPVLFLLAYRGYARHPRADAIHVAVALELLHSFALIHDDLLDDALSRRGHPVLHDWLAGTLPPGAKTVEKVGRDLALLVGDVLHAAAIETFQETGFETAVKERALRILLRTAMQTGAGVFQEVYLRQQPPGSVDRDALMAIYDRKTVRYAFACPLRLAALLGGAAEEEWQYLHLFALKLGIAYQIRDDVADLDAFLDAAPGAAGMRLSETKLMLPLLLLFERAGVSERRWLSALYEQDQADAEERLRLRHLLGVADARESALREAARLCDQAARLCACLRADIFTRRVLRTELLALLEPHAVPETANA